MRFLPILLMLVLAGCSRDKSAAEIEAENYEKGKAAAEGLKKGFSEPFARSHAEAEDKTYGTDFTKRLDAGEDPEKILNEVLVRVVARSKARQAGER
jgi:hypothetical protein